MKIKHTYKHILKIRNIFSDVKRILWQIWLDRYVKIAKGTVLLFLYHFTFFRFYIFVFFSPSTYYSVHFLLLSLYQFAPFISLSLSFTSSLLFLALWFFFLCPNLLPLFTSFVYRFSYSLPQSIHIRRQAGKRAKEKQSDI